MLVSKKSIFKISFLITFVILLSGGQLFAQFPGEARLQLGGERMAVLDQYGLNFGVEYFFADRFSLAPNFTISFPRQGRFTNFNADLRYYFTEGTFQFYGLAGYSNIWINAQSDGAGTRVSRPGGNAGLGGMVKVTSKFGVNAEYKLQSQNFRQHVFRIALVYLL
ncbi:porin family protein [Pararhodonellum marinum]|uniref:outer membrane beta-barrel protein n=1 Tax=Pararhodonellum marinum TaxID=2755358 RepID=UPI00188F1E2B|nr:outer membrane beta-barrel protein [Pararhodonellum marinum]